MSLLLVPLLAIHGFMAIAVSVRGPVHVLDGNCLSGVIAYVASFIINLCGFWPIMLVWILVDRFA